MISTFTGALNGTSYTDPALFALDAKAAGLKPVDHHHTLGVYGTPLLSKYRSPAQLAVLTKPEAAWLGVYVKTEDGRRGQVWALHPMRGYLWVVINGEALAVHQEACTGIRGAGAEVLA